MPGGSVSANGVPAATACGASRCDQATMLSISVGKRAELRQVRFGGLEGHHRDPAAAVGAGGDQRPFRAPRGGASSSAGRASRRAAPAPIVSDGRCRPLRAAGSPLRCRSRGCRASSPRFLTRAAGEARRVDEQQRGRLRQAALRHEVVEHQQVAGRRGRSARRSAACAGGASRPGTEASARASGRARVRLPTRVMFSPPGSGHRDEGGVVGGEPVAAGGRLIRTVAPGGAVKTSGAPSPAGTSTGTVWTGSPLIATRTGSVARRRRRVGDADEDFAFFGAEPVAVGARAGERGVFDRFADFQVFIGGAAAAHLRRRFLGRPQQHDLVVVAGAQARPRAAAPRSGWRRPGRLRGLPSARPASAGLRLRRGRSGSRRRRRSAPLRRRAVRRAVRAAPPRAASIRVRPACFGPHPHRLVDDVDVGGARWRFRRSPGGRGRRRAAPARAAAGGAGAAAAGGRSGGRRRPRPRAGRARRAGCRPRGAAACGGAGAARPAGWRGRARRAPRRSSSVNARSSPRQSFDPLQRFEVVQLQPGARPGDGAAGRPARRRIRSPTWVAPVTCAVRALPPAPCSSAGFLFFLAGFVRARGRVGGLDPHRLRGLAGDRRRLAPLVGALFAARVVGRPAGAAAGFARFRLAPAGSSPGAVGRRFFAPPRRSLSRCPRRACSPFPLCF